MIDPNLIYIPDELWKRLPSLLTSFGAESYVDSTVVDGGLIRSTWFGTPIGIRRSPPYSPWAILAKTDRSAKLDPGAVALVLVACGCKMAGDQDALFATFSLSNGRLPMLRESALPGMEFKFTYEGCPCYAGVYPTNEGFGGYVALFPEKGLPRRHSIRELLIAAGARIREGSELLEPAP